MRAKYGFTLIELMIVIAIIAAIAIPNLLTARLNANETGAIATLRNIISNYTGSLAGNPLDGGVAFRPPGSMSSITGLVATGTVGRDGNLWKQVG